MKINNTYKHTQIGYLMLIVLIAALVLFVVIEIRMKNGKIYRIGTDEPEKLETAIKQAINT